MREKWIRFMQGRYGNDRMNQFLMVVALISIFISFFGGNVFYVLSLALLGYVYFRMLSRNIYKRSAENQVYLKQEMKFRGMFQKQKKELEQRKEYHIYKCPSCKQKIRIPRGRGNIEIRCQKCGNKFVKKS